MKKITLQDIASQLNISKATISIVLNGHGDEKRVSKATHLARGLSVRQGYLDTMWFLAAPERAENGNPS